VITSADGLPHDCISLLPCPTSLGGVVVLTSNAIIYVDQTSRRIALPVNGWLARTSDIQLPHLPPNEQLHNLQLEGCRSAFVDDKTIFVILKDGTVYPVEIAADGKNVSKLIMAPALAQSTIPTVVRQVGREHLFIGSTVGPSVLLKTAQMEEEVEENREMISNPTAVVDLSNGMDLDDDDGEPFVVQAICFSDGLIRYLRNIRTSRRNIFEWIAQWQRCGKDETQSHSSFVV
jgi:cleavage and polyadenylation specificity factor subunit 1